MIKYVLLIIASVMIISACASETVINVTDCSTLQGEMRDQCYANNGIGNYSMPASTGVYDTPASSALSPDVAPASTVAPAQSGNVSGNTSNGSEPRPLPTSENTSNGSEPRPMPTSRMHR